MNPFADPQHPAGYGLIVAAIGAVTREVAVPVLLQHLVGIASALLLFAATRRVARSEWAGLLPAAIVLLNPDQIFLEHSIMSESWIVLSARSGSTRSSGHSTSPDPWWRWPALARWRAGGRGGDPHRRAAVDRGRRLALLLCRAAAAARLAALARPGRGGCGRRRRSCSPSRPPTRRSATASSSLRPGLVPVRARRAVRRLRPLHAAARDRGPLRGHGPLPIGRGAYTTCSTTAQAHSATALPYGGFGESDELVGEWARRAIRAQPGDYLSTVWEYWRAYWRTGAEPGPAGGRELDPQLDFTARLDQGFKAAIIEGTAGNLEKYYRPVHGRRGSAGLEFLRGLRTSPGSGRPCSRSRQR